MPPSGRLIGREGDAAAVAGLLDAGARLVTLWGPGGVGKTRLARECAHRALASGAFAGAWFCDLTAATDAAGICAAVSDALGTQHAAASSVAAVAPLGRSIAARGRALVVLDNFEQVASAAPLVPGAWLEAAPEATFLVTSREALGLGGEVLYEVPPLEPAAAGELLVERMRAHDGARARAHGRTGSEPEIAEIVRRLDFLPLAIELAAAQTAVLGLPDLAARLSQLALASDRRDVPERQRTLRATIDWSWGRLGPAEQAALARLSVFRGGFFPDAAEAVLDVGGERAVELLRALRLRSLVQVSDPDLGGALRLRLLEAVREFAGEKLDGAEARSTRARHAAWYAGRLGAPGGRTLHELALEQENLVAAHRFAVAEPAPELALATTIALAPLLLARGPYELLHRLAGDALSCGDAPPLAQARGVRARALAARRMGRSRDAVDDFARAQALAAAAPGHGGAAALEAAILSDHGRLAAEQGHCRDGEALLARALPLARAAGDRAVEAETLANLGMCCWYDGALARAEGFYHQAAPLARAAGQLALEGRIVANLGALAFERGDLDTFAARTREARVMLLDAGDRRYAAVLSSNLGTGAGDAGRFDEAAAHFDEALAELRAIGDGQGEALVVASVGWMEQLRDGVAAGRGHFQRALALLDGAGIDWADGLVRASLAAALAAAGSVDEARAVAAAAHEIMDRVTDRRLRDVARLTTAHVDLALARRDQAAGDPAGAAARRRQVEALLAGDDRSAEGSRSMIRSARLLLERALAGAAPGVPRRATTHRDPFPAAALLTGDDACGFRPPGGAWVDLRKRRALRRVLAALLDARAATPGRCLATGELFAAGWPGEHAVGQSGAARVHVAVATLRRMGLHDALAHRDDGYLLDPTVPLVPGVRVELAFENA